MAVSDEAASRAQLARRALLDWSFRQRLISREAVAGLWPAEALPHDLYAWLQRLRTVTEQQVGRELWAAAISDRRSTWQALSALLRPHLQHIQGWMLRLVDSLPGDRGYRDVVKEIARTWPASVTRTPSSVVWILAMAQSHRGEVTQDIYPLAAASAFYYQGVVVFDDVGDGELQPICAGWPRGQAEHIAYSLAGALPLAAVDALAVPDTRKVRILRELAEAIWITNIGQYLDLEVLGPVEYPEAQAIEIAQFKTGRGIAKLSRMAGHFLDLDPRAIDAWERATIVCATARQMASDVCDIWHKDPSPDLVTGKCTLPIAYALRQLTGADLEAFRALRRRCRYERSQHDVLRYTLERLGTLQYVQSRLVSWRSAGTQALQEAGVSPAAQEWLFTWISQADVFADIC